MRVGQIENGHDQCESNGQHHFRPVTLCRIDFRLTTSEIRNPDGSVVFRLENVEVPEFWSQVASDVLAQKYFRKPVSPRA